MIKEIKESPQKAFWFNLCLLTKPNMKFMYAFIHSYGYSKRRNGFLSNWKQRKFNQKVQAGTQSKAVDTTTKVRVRVLSPSPSYIEMTELIFFLECPRFSLLGFSGLCLSLTSLIFIGFLFFFFPPPLIEIERSVSLMETS